MFILNRELTKERNIFDQIRVPFQNLAYEKEKQKGTRGRGGKVIGITFTFNPESVLMQKLEKRVKHQHLRSDGDILHYILKHTDHKILTKFLFFIFNYVMII